MSQDWRSEFAQSATEYFKETNQYLGLAALTAGIACLGKPPIFAWAVLCILPFYWQSRFAHYSSKLAALRGIRHDSMSFSTVLRKCWPAAVGWLFLGGVALGVVHLPA